MLLARADEVIEWPQHVAAPVSSCAARTRFIPDSFLHYFESWAWPVAAQASTRRKSERDPVDIGAQLRRMWR
jgi:hypothetical protein